MQLRKAEAEARRLEDEREPQPLIETIERVL